MTIGNFLNGGLIIECIEHNYSLQFNLSLLYEIYATYCLLTTFKSTENDSITIFIIKIVFIHFIAYKYMQ